MPSELKSTLNTWAEHGLGVPFRGISTRLIGRPAVKMVRRVMDCCEEYGAKFTFFITGNTAVVNQGMIREIRDRGHEIACHAYNHIRLDMADDGVVARDLKLARRVFYELFGIELKGFRAPCYGINERVAEQVKNAGFEWSSSLVDSETTLWPGGLPEYPMQTCDWHTIIRDNRPPADLLAEMKERERDKAVFMLHPWHMGQKHRIGVVREYLESARHECVTVSEMHRAGRGVALSGDLGEFKLWELAHRVVSDKLTDYDRIESLLDAGKKKFI